MKKRPVITLLIILSSIMPALACIELRENKIISATSQFCEQNYQLKKGIKIDSNDIIIDCNNAILQGIFRGKTGILLKNRQNIEIKNCMIMNYDTAIELINSTNITITNVALIRNKIGAKLEQSHNNTITKSRDISLTRPIKEIESFDNIFSYENKKINADFCRYNTCNSEIKKTIPIPEEEILRQILMDAIRIWISRD